jgi:hypothetical protein
VEDSVGVDVADNSVESVATKSDVALQHGEVGVDVALRQLFILSCSLVHSSSMVIGLFRPPLDITVRNVLVLNVLFILSHEWVYCRLLEFSEVIVSYRSANVVGLAVQDLVPYGMEFIRLVVVRNRESISSLVSLGVLIVETRSSVERLMQVTDVVDKKT